MTGGIYCEVPFNNIVNPKIVNHMNKKINELFGQTTATTGVDTIFVNKETVRKYILNCLTELCKDGFAKLEPNSQKIKDYLNRTVDLFHSTCFGIYYYGNLVDNEIYYGKKKVKGGIIMIHQGVGRRQAKVTRKHALGPRERAAMFLQEYKPINRMGYTVVLASTMEYAAQVELGDGKAVLAKMAPIIIQPLMNARPKNVTQPISYGYIYEKTGARHQD